MKNINNQETIEKEIPTQEKGPTLDKAVIVGVVKDIEQIISKKEKRNIRKNKRKIRKKPKKRKIKKNERAKL